MSETEAASGRAAGTGPLMDGRICVVTGASSGIGQATSIALARLGATVVLVCRDRGRGESAMAQVSAAATGESPVLELADLSSLEQVRDLSRPTVRPAED